MSMEMNYLPVSVRGVVQTIPTVQMEGVSFVSRGKWLKTAQVYDEHWQPDSIEDPTIIISELKIKIKADIFTFAQKIPETTPKFSYPMEWDNLAVIPITSFADWWETRLPQETRKNVRRAAKRGVVTRSVAFDDIVAQGLKKIYDETPVRQGRRFWHYRKDIDTVRRENSSYLDCCEFIAAYFENELIGLLKMVYVGQMATIMQIVSLNKHLDKRPTNALLAKAVEVCAERKMGHFVYGQYVYGKNSNSPLTEFKRRNGFEQILLPRYFIPLTTKGKLAIALKLHLGLRRMLPRGIETALQEWRAKVYEKTVLNRSEKEPEGIIAR